jgi:7-cyano-7-deazaguanine synthase
MSKGKALVVLSGGQDSTTCLYWANAQGYEVHAVTFNYGQRHVREIASAIHIAQMADVVTHEVINLGSEVLKGTSPLVNKAEVLEQYADHHSLPGGLEKTFVPMRNQLFLTIAANRAYVLGCNTLITGVCEEDFGGYPDCRAVFIDALAEAINYGTFTPDQPLGPLRILTPLMHLTKKATVELAVGLPGCMEALAFSHTSYDGAYPPVGKDHATLLRAKGFEESGYADPLVVRAWREGLMDLPSTVNYDSLR